MEKDIENDVLPIYAPKECRYGVRVGGFSKSFIEEFLGLEDIRMIKTEKDKIQVYNTEGVSCYEVSTLIALLEERGWEITYDNEENKSITSINFGLYGIRDDNSLPQEGVPFQILNLLHGYAECTLEEMIDYVTAM